MKPTKDGGIRPMRTRKEILSSFYGQTDEDGRLKRSRHGQLEYATTMAYIHRFADSGAKVLEVGAGTGRYSIALAKEGMRVTAVELVESNLALLRENGKGIGNLDAYQGDATDLGRFADDSFDVTLLLGPMYHLFEAEEVNRAIDEAIRVTKPGGVILFAFISVFAIMYANYLSGNWAEGQEENFTADYRVRHFQEQLFTGYDVVEFERLFDEKPVTWITTAGVDGLLEPIEKRPDFSIPDADFAAFAAWHLQFAEKRELLGHTNHLLYICRKNPQPND
jgi:SAM-dependent methyltransferase